MSEKIIEIKDYLNKKHAKTNVTDEKSYEEILSEIYADDLTQEFRKYLGKDEKS